MVIADMLIKALEDYLNKKVAELHGGCLIFVFPNGSKVRLGTSPEERRVAFTSWRGLWLIAFRGSLGFTEGYIKDYWHTEDLMDLMNFLAKNYEAFQKLIEGKSPLKLMTKLKHRRRKNTEKGSQKNIEAHYDLGNSFYQLWLDSSMTYSSALYDEAHEDLESAQQNKYARALRSLNLKDNASILEIGCGWGGFMEFATQREFKVKGITISPNQLEYARQRLARFDHRHELELIDYRKVEGPFDAIVSIEMFEAVGSDYWHTFFARIKELLVSKGKVMIQTIMIQDQFFDDYRKSPDFIQTYIFPGGELACPRVISELASANDLEIVNTVSFPLSYSKTLEEWHGRFQTAWPEIMSKGFDQEFKRTWDMYLAYCRGGFANGRLLVNQYTFQLND